jgi:hypothetical protein
VKKKAGKKLSAPFFRMTCKCGVTFSGKGGAFGNAWVAHVSQCDPSVGGYANLKRLTYRGAA